MRDNVPVILRPDRNTRPFRRLPGPSLGDRVVDLPLIRRDFFLVPNALIVMPLMTPADLHPRVPASFEFLEPVVGLGVIPLKCCGLGFGDTPGALFCHTFSPHTFRTAIQCPSRWADLKVGLTERAPQLYAWSMTAHRLPHGNGHADYRPRRNGLQ